MHIDMDAFFAAIEEREHPEFRGQPIVVGADPKGGKGRGVVSTANYPARKYGIKSAMPISRAWRLCPTAVYLPVDGKLYGIVSQRIMRIVRECIGDAPMEQVSVDEAYVAIRNEECRIKNCWNYAEKIAREIKQEILKRERLTCSIGIGPNKLIAKIASDFKKPDGLTIVRQDKIRAFLDSMPVRKLPGIGPKSEAELLRRGIETVRELWLAVPENSELGKLAAGQDDSEVSEDYAAKSFGHEITFEKDTRDQALLTRAILELCGEVIGEIMHEKVLFRTVTIRVRFDNFETHTSSHTLRAATQNGTILQREALRLLFPYFLKRRLIRLIGVRVSNFQERR